MRPLAWPCKLLARATFAVAVALQAGPLLAQTSAECLACHEDASLKMQKQGKTVSLFVQPSTLAGSVHKDLSCSDCHAGFDPTSFPHRKAAEPVDCTACHPDITKEHGFHARMASASGREDEPGLSCTGCHGSHEVVPPKKEGGPWSGKRLVVSCGNCHGDLALQFSNSGHGRALEAGIQGAPDCLKCHENPISHARQAEHAKQQVTVEKLCLSCHLDDENVRAQVGPSAGFIKAYETSVHGAALLAGNVKAANCVSCHGSHEMKRGMDPSSKTAKIHIAETCAQCHGEISVAYAQSVHGRALMRGALESPTCTDCHGEHTILPHDDPRSPVAAANVSERVCSPCHESLRLTEKYAVPSGRVSSYGVSFHGLAVRGGVVEAANCASCHGSHEIKPSRDPESTVHKANLAATCGQSGCHQGAGARFAVGSVHVLTSPASEEPILYWISTLYIGMIVGTVGGMFLHNLLDFLKKVRRRLHAHRHGHLEEPFPHALHLRMTISERLQHASLVISFFVLVLTGFMLRFPDAFWVQWLRRLSDNLFVYRAWLHRIAAVVMVVASVYHVYYVAFTRRGRQLIRDLFPRREDALDVLNVFRFNLGISKHKPKFARFSYIEKAEYWALIWGTIVMAVTGAILWADNTSMNVLTKLGTDIARAVHWYEAILATLAIIVWHFYFVLLNPDVYPMSFAWLTGMLTEREMEEEHALELEAIRRQRLAEEALLARSNGVPSGDDLSRPPAGREPLGPSAEA